MLLRISRHANKTKSRAKPATTARPSAKPVAAPKPSARPAASKRPTKKGKPAKTEYLYPNVRFARDKVYVFYKRRLYPKGKSRTQDVAMRIYPLKWFHGK